MADVFISYSKKEHALTASLAADLESQGYSVWWDASLVPGDDFSDVITTELKNAKVVIVIWTPTSIRSTWVRWEATAAAEMKKLVPVRSSTIRVTDIPAPFSMYETSLLEERRKIYDALKKQAPTIYNKVLDIKPTAVQKAPLPRIGQLPIFEEPKQLSLSTGIKFGALAGIAIYMATMATIFQTVYPDGFWNIPSFITSIIISMLIMVQTALGVAIWLGLLGKRDWISAAMVMSALLCIGENGLFLHYYYHSVDAESTGVIISLVSWGAGAGVFVAIGPKLDR